MALKRVYLGGGGRVGEHARQARMCVMAKTGARARGITFVVISTPALKWSGWHPEVRQAVIRENLFKYLYFFKYYAHIY